tara:strand:+ start:345 stop:713 length:369 start_codon:yes stop_codon:yes gene_type:complete
MMHTKNTTPTELANALLSRSLCNVQMAAVISDNRGIFAWGWNHVGHDGMGEHAEAAAIRRGNRQRFPYATITIVGWRQFRGRHVTSLPCMDCMDRIKAAGIPYVQYWQEDKWITFPVDSDID